MLMNNMDKSVVYIARDLERALGFPLNTPNYYIISNFSAFGKRVAGARKNVLLIKSARILDTRELLAHPKTKKFINSVCHREEHSDEAISRHCHPDENRDLCPSILVFKPTTAIEKICTDNYWPLLNPSAKLSAQVEEKISQVEWLGPLAKNFLPPFQIKECGQIKWPGNKFILQFNFAHTGQGTILVESKKQLSEIKKKFPARPARVTKYIAGPMFTNNNVVWGKKVLIGNINYQITGLKPFTNNPFATIGNDWALPHKILTGVQKKQYETIARSVGERLAKSGWKGLFGIDVIMEEKTGKLYLIEINARQPASTTYESQLQTSNTSTLSSRRKSGSLSGKNVTTFTAHLLALSGAKYSNQKLIKIKTGAQIVQRVVPVKKKISNLLMLKNIKQAAQDGLRILPYDNTDIESDWFRIQVKEGVMLSHGVFNNFAASGPALFAMSTTLAKSWHSTRAGAVIIRGNKLLIFKRQRLDKKYYSLPGGTVEPGENKIATMRREVFEETGLLVKKQSLAFYNIGKRRKSYYYDVVVNDTQPIFGGEEKERQSPENYYQLMWVNLDRIKDLEFSNKYIKEKLLCYLKTRKKS